MTSMISRVLLAIALVLGCDDPEPVAEPEPRVEHDFPISPTPVVPVEIHEWGLIDGDSLHAGHPIRSVRPRLRAPVLYAHLPENSPHPEGRLDSLTVRVGSEHRVMEHYPGGGALMPGEPLVWQGIQVHAGSCRTPNYPSVGDAACRTEDRVCEAAHGRTWETGDGDCLQYGGQSWNHFFYRVTLGGELTLPVRHEMNGDVLSVETDATLVGNVYRTHEGAVAWADAPSTGASAELAQPTESDAAAATERIKADLGFHGLTPEEADAFMREWDDLFGGRNLLYWMPSTTLDSIAAIEGENVTVKRAVLVRVPLT